MAGLAKALSRYSKVLKNEFEAARAVSTAASTKGGLNEKIVARFLEKCVPSWFTSNNSQIIDSHEQISDEVDVCVCNDQQFLVQPEGGILIAEGVDFVVQVKALLTDNELDRAIRNARTVKKLKRAHVGDTTVYNAGILEPKWFDFIPYFCFAFSSELTDKTVSMKLNEKSNGIDFTQQMDAIFILDRGLTVINGRDGRNHSWRDPKGKLVTGWHGVKTKEDTLLEFIRYCIQYVPRIRHSMPPIVEYFPKKSQYPAVN